MAEAGYPRDLHGYGRNPPNPHWPGHARVAVQFVVNFEEGGENNILHGDHYEIEGVIELKPNARVCLASDAERFLQLFVSRIRGK